MDAEVANLAAWLAIVLLATLVLAGARWVGRRLSPWIVGILVRLRVIA